MDLQEILQKLGWEDGFQIPIANQENQQLEKEVARLNLKRIKCKTANETSVNRLDGLEKHLKYLDQESEHIQQLFSVHTQQLENEENKLRVLTNEKSRYEHDIREVNKQCTERTERFNTKKDQLERNAMKLAKLKIETNWDEEALKAWDDSLQKRSEDNELIKKFSNEDQRKYNELEAKRKNLQIEHLTRSETVTNMVKDITNYERIIERTGKILQEQMAEKDALINQWKNSVQILRQRDNEIDRIQIHLTEAEDIRDRQLEKLEEHDQFLKNEIKNNDELNQEIDELNLINSKLRKELNETIQYIFLITNESNILKRVLTSVANKLEKERAQSKELTKFVNEKEQQINKYDQDLIQLKQKFEELIRKHLSARDRTKHIEKMIEFEQKKYDSLLKDSSNIQIILFNSQQTLQNEINIGKMKDFEANGFITYINNLNKQNFETDKQVIKQKELIYTIEYKIDEIQSKIMVAETGSTKDEHSNELKDKLIQMEATLEEQTELKNLLRVQVLRVLDDMRRITTALTTDNIKFDKLKEKLHTQTLNYDAGQKQLIQIKQQFQQKQVEENMLLVRYNQFVKTKTKTEKNIYSLQRFRLALEQAMMERLLEISANKEILLSKRRNLSEDKSRLKCDLNGRLIKIEQFQKKYYLVLMTFGKDEDGKPLSITHFKIKNAQEKYMLQQEGDELDCKIKKAEKEIIAMENTLKIVNATNLTFKESLGAVEDKGLEMNEMNKLKDELHELTNKIRQYKKELAEKKQEIIDLESNLSTMHEKKTETQNQLQQLKQEFIQNEEQKIKKEKQIRKYELNLKQLQKKINKSAIDKYERDLEIRQLKETNKEILERLRELTNRYYEIAPLINRYALQYDIKMPDRRLTPSTSSESHLSITNSSDIRSIKSIRSEKTNISKVVLSFEL